MKRLLKVVLVLGFLVGLAGVGFAEEKNLVKNPSFEEGSEKMPNDWFLSEGAEGAWESEGYTGAHSVSLICKEDRLDWWCTKVKLEKRRLYRLSFYSKHSPETIGFSNSCIPSGPPFCIRGFRSGESWRRYAYTFVVPEGIDIADTIVRVGYWRKKGGKIFFDDISLTPVEAIHKTEGGITLGKGEKIEGKIYTFESDFGYEGSNYSRPLFKTNCYFNGNYWCFGPGSYLIYKHQINGVKQTAGKVRVTIGYYVKGDCLVDASIDGASWQQLGKLSGKETKEFDLPETFFPAEVVYIRISSSKSKDNLGNFQVYNYRYTGGLEKEVASFDGDTKFIDIRKMAKGFEVRILSAGGTIPGKDNQIKVSIKGTEGQKIDSEIRIVFKGREDVFKKEIALTGKEDVFLLPYEINGTEDGQLILSLFADKEKVYEASFEFFVPVLYASDYGETIKKDRDATIWWCEGTYKVGRERPVPKKQARYAKIYLAKGEYEPLQIVIRPNRDLKVVTARMEGELSSAWTIDYVYYHYVKYPTDYTSCKDFWPDALPHLTKPIDLKAGINQPIWLTLKAPRDIKAGEYRSTLVLKSEDHWEEKVPILVHIFGFELPKETHLESGFGCWPVGNIWRYHNLETEEEKRYVYDLYMQNFREHRISPYSFAPLDPIRVSIPESPEDGVKIDFSAWDKQAEKYLNEYGFTNFVLNIEGIGNGSVSRGTWRKGKLGRFEEGTPEYKKLFDDYLTKLQNHLEEKGWLKKAYIYWYDEPGPAEYPNVISGMKNIKSAAPKLTRLLTEEQQPELIGYVDIWCPVLHYAFLDEVENCHKRGERVWWYLCCDPIAPYPGNFIDHPGIDFRAWVWMNWKYNIDGILLWTTIYWTESKWAFPDPNNIQNPYEDPMAYSNIPGSLWHSGDGRLLYPPNMDVNKDKTKYLEGPVNSIRWEILREGMEDYEYFWLLRELTKKAKEKGLDTNQEEKLLTIPENIIKDRTNFTKDPKPLYEWRLRLAEAIERLWRYR